MIIAQYASIQPSSVAGNKLLHAPSWTCTSCSKGWTGTGSKEQKKVS